MKIALSTDHAGLEFIKLLEKYLQAQGHDCLYFGPSSYIADDDYPDFIFPAAKSLAGGQCELGIIMGGSGQGESIAANRVPGVRCAVYYGKATPLATIDVDGSGPLDEYEIIRLSRQHNNSNMLSLAARFLDFEEIKKVVDIWLNTSFSGAERHRRRIDKLDVLD